MNHIENYGTVFIPINNILNSFCFHVAVLQRFHTSKTFNKLISTFNSENKYLELMMKPFIEYSKINLSNINDTYKNIKSSYSELINEIIDEGGKNGFSPFLLTYIYILPIIYHLFPSKFADICSEIGIDETFFNSPIISVNNILESSPFIKPEYRNFQLKLVENLSNDYLNKKFRFTLNGFKSAILEIYPNKNSFDGGHAIFILKDEFKENLYYIFDDDTTIDLFKNYVKNRKNFIYKICIREIDENTIQELQSLWGSNILTRRVNNRWEFINKDHKGEDMEKISCRFISIHENKNKNDVIVDENISGGDLSREKSLNLNQFKFPFIISLIINLIIVIIVIVIICINKKEKYIYINNFNH